MCLFVLKTENRHDANFVVISGTKGYIYDNRKCHLWRQSWHHDDYRFYVKCYSNHQIPFIWYVFRALSMTCIALRRSNSCGENFNQIKQMQICPTIPEIKFLNVPCGGCHCLEFWSKNLCLYASVGCILVFNQNKLFNGKLHKSLRFVCLERGIWLCIYYRFHPRSPIFQHGFTSIPAWIRNHIQ